MVNIACIWEKKKACLWKTYILILIHENWRQYMVEIIIVDLRNNYITSFNAIKIYKNQVNQLHRYEVKIHKPPFFCLSRSILTTWEFELRYPLPQINSR